MITDLGTIARSWSKAFMNEISGPEPQLYPFRGIIGEFEMGLYIAFMRACKAEVRSEQIC
jgi:HSP90 family molecular chaperone